MQAVLAEAAAAIVVVLLVILVVIFGTLMGGVAGWIVGLFFTETIIVTLSRFGVETFNMTMWQLGATLGFVSGFFKSSGVKVNQK